MSLVDVAKDNLTIFERGTYRAPSGREVSVRDAVVRAVAGTVLYRPGEPAQSPAQPARALRVEVTDESTGQAARRLVQAERVPRVVALNFASARQPGGGFLTGAKAQEEDLARCSALYPCLLTQRAFYDANRAHGSHLYTDHVIHSPDVPFFRDERYGLIETPFAVSIITAPAPNAGEYLRREPGGTAHVRAALERRAAQVLAVARAEGHACVLLGAWGCGVFRNDPAEVADVFGNALTEAGGAFERVVFAVYDRRPGQTTLRAFTERLAAS